MPLNTSAVPFDLLDDHGQQASQAVSKAVCPEELQMYGHWTDSLLTVQASLSIEWLITKSDIQIKENLELQSILEDLKKSPYATAA